MRTAFIKELIDQARSHPDIFLVVGDLGFSVVEPFASEFPDRFLNAGVAEQNMTGVAAGLASEGYHVFTYSIANFPTMRCLEQIRNDICYHQLAVTVVAVGGGFAYGNLGYSHHAVEDLGIMLTLPGMTVAAPADPVETRLVLDELVRHRKPSYLRLGKAGERSLHRQAPAAAKLGQPLLFRSGRDVTLCTTGGVLDHAIAVADALQREGVSVQIVTMPWLAPVDSARLGELIDGTQRVVVSIEEHGRQGLANVIMEAGLAQAMPLRLLPLRLSGYPPISAGSQAYCRAQYGLDLSANLQAIRVHIGSIGGPTCR